MQTLASVESVCAAIAAGQRLKYVYFWGHQPQRDGGVGSGCLSQWWPARFTVESRDFATAEHFMMWRKAMLFDDVEVASRVLLATHPGQAKRFGREVRGFDQAIWARERFAIVVEGSVAKFGQHPDLADYLLRNGDRVLVEASPLDNVWGIGLAADDERAADPHHWQGLNLLGFALMAARERLR